MDNSAPRNAFTTLHIHHMIFSLLALLKVIIWQSWCLSVLLITNNTNPRSHKSALCHSFFFLQWPISRFYCKLEGCYGNQVNITTRSSKPLLHNASARTPNNVPRRKEHRMLPVACLGMMERKRLKICPPQKCTDIPLRLKLSTSWCTVPAGSSNSHYSCILEIM